MRYEQLLDSSGRISLEKIVSSYPEIGCIKKGRLRSFLQNFSGLMFSHFGEILFDSNDFEALRCVAETLPNKSKDYLLANLKSYDASQYPSSFKLEHPAVLGSLDDITDKIMLASRTSFYHKPIDPDKNPRSNVDELDAKIIQSLDYLRSLPDACKGTTLRKMKLIGYENLLNIFSFMGYAAFNTYIATIKDDDDHSKEIRRKISSVWPALKNIILNVAQAYVLTIDGRDTSAKNRNIIRDYNRLKSKKAGLYPVLKNMQYRLREGDKIENIILHGIRHFSKSRDKDKNINYLSILWGGSYVAPFMAAIGRELSGTEDNFDYIQFSKHHIEVFRRNYINRAKELIINSFGGNSNTYVDPKSMSRQQFSDFSVYVKKHIQQIKQQLSSEFGVWIPKFVFKYCNRKDVVLCDDVLGSGLTLHFTSDMMHEMHAQSYSCLPVSYHESADMSVWPDKNSSIPVEEKMRSIRELINLDWGILGVSEGTNIFVSLKTDQDKIYAKKDDELDDIAKRLVIILNDSRLELSPSTTKISVLRYDNHIRAVNRLYRR